MRQKYVKPPLDDAQQATLTKPGHTVRPRVGVLSENTKKLFDDITGWFPPLPEENEHHHHDETCNFVFGECDLPAKYFIRSRPLGCPTSVISFYCARHFALRLHMIIDEVTNNDWFDELKTPQQRKRAVQTYFCGWGHVNS